MTETEWLGCTKPTRMLEYLRGPMASKETRLPSGEPIQVTDYPDCQVSDRKLILFSCGCCRRIWHLLSDRPSRQAIEVAERFVDGTATRGEMIEAEESAHGVAEGQYRAVYDAANKEATASNDPDAPNWVHGAHDCARSACAAACAAWYATCVSCPADHAMDAFMAIQEAVNHAASPLLFTEECVPDLALRECVEEAEERAQAILLRDIVGNPYRPATPDPRWRDPTVTRVAEAIYQERSFEDLPILADALEEVGCSDADLLAHCRQGGIHVRGCSALDLVLGRT